MNDITADEAAKIVKGLALQFPRWRFLFLTDGDSLWYSAQRKEAPYVEVEKAQVEPLRQALRDLDAVFDQHNVT